MSDKIVEIDLEKKPTNLPQEMGGHIIDQETIKQVSANSVSGENYPTPVVDERMVAKNKEGEKIELGDIPGVKEVTISPVEENRSVPETRPVSPEVQELLKNNFNAKQFFRSAMNGGFINQIIKRYDLEGVDLEKECELIDKKQSHLSANKRKIVKQLFKMRQQQQALMRDLSQELLHKDNPSDEDLKNLLDSIPDGNTTVNVAEAMKEAEVNHNVGEEIPAEVVEAEKAEAFETAESNAAIVSAPVPEVTVNADGSIPIKVEG